jgi:tRNA threonylcarbamoyladenosine biosynthesis protein TsaE
MREPGRLSVLLADEAATRAAGAALARALEAAGEEARFVALSGELGAGKTTLVRGLLGALGIAGPVRSPTYTLLESYEAGARRVHHFDWYRLGSATDLEALGFRDLLVPGQWLLAEWPERVPEAARRADLMLHLAYEAGGRRLTGTAGTPAGHAVIASLKTSIT